MKELVVRLDEDSARDCELFDWLSSVPNSTIKDLLQAVYAVVCCNSVSENDVASAANLLKRLVTDSGLSLSTEAIQVHVLRERERLSEEHSAKITELQKHNSDLYQQLLSTNAKLEEFSNNMELNLSTQVSQATATAEREKLELQNLLDSEKAHNRARVLDECLKLQQNHAVEIAHLHAQFQNNTGPLLTQMTALVEQHVNGLQNNVGGGLSNLRDLMSALQSALSSPLAKIEKYVDKFEVKDSASKGRVMEDKFFVLLTGALPQYEVELCRDAAHAMDIRLVSDTGQKVLIDVKNYTHNVGSREIRKFHQDVKTNECSGVLLSVSSGIATKSHMQLDVIANKYPVIYLNSIHGDVEAVAAAVNVLRSVDKFIDQNKGEISFDEEALYNMTETVKRLHRTASSLKENNEKQRRLIGELETDYLLNTLTGALVKNKRSEHATVKPAAQIADDSVGGGCSNSINLPLDVEPSLEADCRKFCDLAVEPGNKEANYLTLKDARQKWCELHESKELNSPAPSPSELKATLQSVLNTDYLKKKHICGKVVYGLFSGVSLK